MTGQVESVPAVAPTSDNEIPAVSWSEEAILRALERCDRFGPPSNAFLTHVHPRVGGTRESDGVSIGIWVSRGLLIQGIEVKTSRSDWLRELKKPEKAEGSVFRFCDRWWLATPRSVKVVREGELPSPWGHVAVDGRGVHVEREAPDLQPDAVDRPFVAEVLRRAVEQLPEERRLRRSWSEGFAAGTAQERELAEERSKRLEEKNAELHSIIESFEKIIGQRIVQWSGAEQAERVRRALAFVLDNGHENAIHRLEQIRRHTAQLLEQMDKSLKEASG